MERGERREGMQPQYIKIEGSVYLEQGQNFYDQQPFNLILPKIAEKHEMDLPILRHGLTTLAQELVSALPQDKDSVVKKFRYKPLWGYKNTYQARMTHVEGVIEAARALDVLPEWDSYIFQQLAQEKYRGDGEYRESGTDPSKTRSYGAWLENKLTRNARIQSAAIKSVVAEALPQEDKSQSVQHASRQNIRSWLIRKASGIKPSK